GFTLVDLRQRDRALHALRPNWCTAAVGGDDSAGEGTDWSIGTHRHGFQLHGKLRGWSRSARDFFVCYGKRNDCGLESRCESDGCCDEEGPFGCSVVQRHGARDHCCRTSVIRYKL